MNPADQRWWRDRENSGALACQRGPASPAGSPRLASAATLAAVAGGAAATVASTVAAAAGTAAGAVAGGGKATVPAGRETQSGLGDPWPCCCHC